MKRHKCFGPVLRGWKSPQLLPPRLGWRHAGTSPAMAQTQGGTAELDCAGSVGRAARMGTRMGQGLSCRTPAAPGSAGVCWLQEKVWKVWEKIWKVLAGAHQKVSPKWTPSSAHFTQGRLLWDSLLMSQGAAGHKGQCFSLCLTSYFHAHT